jgi:NAD(P)-dependent dehydrogenase (short-subunit alcohol dehydrogenase family)
MAGGSDITGMLKNKEILVTGANSGIGWATALTLAEEGARVVASARREARGREPIARIKERGGEATWVNADIVALTRSAAVEYAEQGMGLRG